MKEMQKITVHVPVSLIEATMKATGKGISETVRGALEDLRHRKAGEALLAWRAAGGRFKFDISYKDRKDKE